MGTEAVRDWVGCSPSGEGGEVPDGARDARLTIVATGSVVALNCAAGELALRPRSGAGQIEAGMGAAAKLWSGRSGGDRFGLPWEITGKGGC